MEVTMKLMKNMIFLIALVFAISPLQADWRSWAKPVAKVAAGLSLFCAGALATKLWERIQSVQKVKEAQKEFQHQFAIPGSSARLEQDNCQLMTKNLQLEREKKDLQSQYDKLKNLDDLRVSALQESNSLIKDLQLSLARLREELSGELQLGYARVKRFTNFATQISQRNQQNLHVPKAPGVNDRMSVSYRDSDSDTVRTALDLSEYGSYYDRDDSLSACSFKSAKTDPTKP